MNITAFRIISGRKRQTLFIRDWRYTIPIRDSEGCIIGQDDVCIPDNFHKVSTLIETLELATDRRHILYPIRPYNSSMELFYANWSPTCKEVNTKTGDRVMQLVSMDGASRVIELAYVGEGTALDWKLGGWRVKGDTSEKLLDGVIPACMWGISLGLGIGSILAK